MNNINNILVKCYRNETLTDEEIKFVDVYRNEELFYTLKSDVQQDMLDLIGFVDKIKFEKEENNHKLGIKKPYVKKLGEWPGYREMIKKGVY